MTKHIYTAIDIDGIEHKRTSTSRGEGKPYSHTVVVKGGYERAMAGATGDWHPKQDARNYAYYVAISEGNDPHARLTVYKSLARGDTQEAIDAEIAYNDRENTRRFEEAKAEVGNHTVQSYIAAQLAERIAHVEARKAAGEFDTWHNAGWCGRLDLAQKLAATKAALGYAVAVLPAVKKGA